MLARGQSSAPPKAAITSSAMLWTLPGSFEEKLETVARAGLQSVELLGEHTGWSAEDIRRFRHTAESFRLRIDVIGANPHWREKAVSMVDPGQRDGLLAEVRKNIEVALELGAPMLVLMAGLAVDGLSHDQQIENLVASCRQCGDLAAEAGVGLLVEPLNNRDEPGFFLNSCVEGLEVVKRAGHPHVRLLFDLYHEQVQSGNLIATIENAAPYVAVFHVADNPGRHEPGTGEIYFPNVYRAIRDVDFDGYIAMEYLPATDPVRSLIRSVDGMRAALADRKG